MSDRTKFERWVKQYGVAKLVEQLKNRGEDCQVSTGMIYQWMRGDHEPRLAKRRAILEISGGELLGADLEAHFLAKRRPTPAAAT